MAIQQVTATFTGAEDSVAVTWPAMAGSFGINFGETISDALGGVEVWTTAATRSSTGCTIFNSARFSGTVELIIYDKTP